VHRLRLPFLSRKRGQRSDEKRLSPDGRDKERKDISTLFNVRSNQLSVQFAGIDLT
jgi:hypothetical protein